MRENGNEPGLLAREIDGSQDELVSLCQELVRIDSVTGGGKEVDAAKFFASWLKERGVNVVVEDYFDGRGNVIALANEGAGGPRLVFNGHLDVVPVAAGERWRGNMDPFGGTLKGKHVYGRGAVDMKGNLAAMAVAAVALGKLGSGLKGQLVLHAVSDEEQGGDLGTMRSIEKFPEYFSNVEAVVIGESTMMPGFPLGISYSEKGIIWLELTTHGESMHGSMGDLEESAIIKMMKVVDAIRARLAIDVEPLHGEDVLKGYLAHGIGREAVDRLWEDETIFKKIVQANLRLTKSLTMFHAGEKENQVPATCTALFDIRSMPEHDQAAIMEKARTIIQDLGYTVGDGTSGVDVTLTAKMKNEASRMDDHQHRIIGAIQRANKEVFNNDAFLIAFPASSDARLFRNVFPGRLAPVCKNTVMYGAGEAMLSHAKNERMAVDDLVRIAKAYALAAWTFLS